MGNTTSSTRSFPTPTPTSTHSWSITTHGPPIVSIPYATGASTYTSIIPIYTTNSYVEEICHHGIDDEATETCLTTTKTVTDLVSFSESVIRQSASRPSASRPSHTSVVSSIPWCPDYPYCASSSSRTRHSFTFSRSTYSWSKHSHSHHSQSRTTRSLSTRRGSTSYAVTSTLWDNSSTWFPWLTTESLTSPNWSETLSIQTTSPESGSESCTDILCILTSSLDEYTTTSSSSCSRSRSRTRTRTRTTSSHTWFHSYTHYPTTTTSDDEEVTVFSDPFPAPTTSDDECEIFNWWWCTSSSSSDSTSSSCSSSSSSSHHHKPTHSLSLSSSCLWWDFYCSSGTESPPFSTEVPETALPCETTSSSSTRHTITRPSSITWVPETFSDTYFPEVSTLATGLGEEPDDDDNVDEGGDDGGLFSYH